MPPKTSRVDDIDCLRLIYAGRVTQLQKRVWDFVPLVDHLLEAGVRFRFDVYGDGDQFEPLRDAMLRDSRRTASISMAGCPTTRWRACGRVTTSSFRRPTLKAPA